jgi:hypothetical protein
MKNRTLQKLLTKRSLDVGKLADQIFSSRSHVTQVLLGQRRGANTWAKLKRVMTEEEYKSAKNYADGELKQREKSGKYNGAFPVAPKSKAGLLVAK